jgi:subtilisin family serine protease
VIVRKNHLFALGLALMLAVVAVTTAGGGARAQETDYVVLYKEGASLASARQAVRAAGGAIVSENTAVGVATVRSTSASFASAVAGQSALAGAAQNRPVGYATPLERPTREQVERLSDAERATVEAAATAGKPAKPPKPPKQKPGDPDPLAGLQWNMAMIHATAGETYKKDPGKPGVLVGIIDTGVDASHPDIAPNFSHELSRNFTTDIPDADGPCEVPSCKDPADVDEGGHGTHVAGIVGAALNGIGVAGVAPKVTLVNLRAGQDSGFFFLQPTVDALTYAADNGIDVVNMSYFVDPWLFNCASNPADSPAQQEEQRVIIEATQRALHYAHMHNVTLIASEGNEHTNLDNPTSDDISPDYPPGIEYHRDVDNSCLVLPTEGEHVISIGAVGPSGIKADYSNWGFEQTAVTAPGGYFRDYAGTPQNRQVGNLVLSTYPEQVAEEEGSLNPDGTPATPFVVRDCQGSVCGYYEYLQGTSMAGPHATGVAALIISRFGKHVPGPGQQLTMDPDDVEKVLRASATDSPCPVPATIDYTIPGRDRPASYNATCEGTPELNSIYGDGVINAFAAVNAKLKQK